MRLVDGARESEGRVEIFNDGEWGTVCDDHWDINDANVVCKMLNYSRALRAPGKAFFGRGNGKIWLGSVNCRGNEISLLQCGQPGWNVDSCDHHEDASVICESEAAHLGKPATDVRKNAAVTYDSKCNVLKIEMFVFECSAAALTSWVKSRLRVQFYSLPAANTVS